MDKVKIIEVKQSVFASNEKKADELRSELKEKNCFLLNVMSSPGSGKTTTLTKVINNLKDEFKIAVMEADIDSDVDAKTIASETGVDVIQLHTGGMCHIDAGMTKEGIENLEKNDYDLIILENVGNLVCPAEFDTGAIKNMCILSVPEGDDKPLKYPLVFEVSNFVVINKIDVMPYFDFDLEKCKKNIHMRNSSLDIFTISAKTGEGIAELSEYIKNEINNFNNL